MDGVGAVSEVQFGVDGSRLYAFMREGDIAVFDTETGERESRLEAHGKAIEIAVFSGNGGRLVTGDADGIVVLWDLAGNRKLFGLPHDGNAVDEATFSPDGSRLVTITRSYVARLWDTGSGALLGVQDDVWSRSVPEFASNGNIVTFYASTARVWNADMTEVISTIDGHTGDLADADISPDGERVVTASFDRTVRLWDVASGLEISRFYGHADWVTHAEFLAQGRRVLSASLDGTARMWRVLPGGQELIDLARERLPPSRSKLTRDEQSRFLEY